MIPQRFGGPDSDENIVRVCDRCHKKLERLYDKSFYEWFGIDDEQGSIRFHRPCGWPSCENMAEVKIGHGIPMGNNLYCKKCAVKWVVKGYIKKHKRKRSGRLIRTEHVADTITEFWDSVVEKSKLDGRPEYLEQYYSDTVANEEFL